MRIEEMVSKLNEIGMPEVKGLKTRRGAEKRLAGLDATVMTTIVEREDGTFVPVALLGDSTMYLAYALAVNGVFVTNAR